MTFPYVEFHCKARVYIQTYVSQPCFPSVCVCMCVWMCVYMCVCVCFWMWQTYHLILITILRRVGRQWLWETQFEFEMLYVCVCVCDCVCVYVIVCVCVCFSLHRNPHPQITCISHCIPLQLCPNSVGIRIAPNQCITIPSPSPSFIHFHHISITSNAIDYQQKPSLQWHQYRCKHSYPCCG